MYLVGCGAQPSATARCHDRSPSARVAVLCKIGACIAITYCDGVGGDSCAKPLHQASPGITRRPHAAWGQPETPPVKTSGTRAASPMSNREGHVHCLGTTSVRAPHRKGATPCWDGCASSGGPAASRGSSSASGGRCNARSGAAFCAPHGEWCGGGCGTAGVEASRSGAEPWKYRHLASKQRLGGAPYPRTSLRATWEGLDSRLSGFSHVAPREHPVRGAHLVDLGEVLCEHCLDTSFIFLRQKTPPFEGWGCMALWQALCYTTCLPQDLRESTLAEVASGHDMTV